MNSLRENGKQSATNCRTASAPSPASTRGSAGRSHRALAFSVDEQPLADGCEAEMIHTDSAVSFSLPLKDRLSVRCRPSRERRLFLQSIWQARHSKYIFMAPFTLTGARFKALLEIAWKDKQSKQCMTAANSLVAALHCVTRAHYTLLFFSP